MEDQVSRRPATSTTTTTKAQPPSPYQKYLFAYNALSFAAWSIITLSAISLIIALGYDGHLEGVFEGLFPIVKWVQTFALLEVAHSTLGLVRANPFTTAIQVSSRILVVWAVLHMYPEIVMTRNFVGRVVAGENGGPLAFAGILVAWGVTEVIRYGFFVYKEGVSTAIPSWLTWLRYNTFFVLYPIGISSECWLMWLACKPAAEHGYGLEWLYVITLMIYVPGSYILYTHMMAQRRKVLKGKDKVR